MTDRVPETRGVSEARRPSGKLARNRRFRRGAEVAWVAAIALIAAAVLYASAISTLALSDSFCSSCHGRQAAQQKATAHSGVTCDACHGSTNFFGAADRRLAQVSMVTAAFVPGSQSMALPVENAACLACHQKAMLGTVKANGIIMSHKEVLAANWSCATCHANTAHGTTVTTPSYSMDACLSCHFVTPTDVKSCEKCHDGDRPTQLASNSQWKLVHGRNGARRTDSATSTHARHATPSTSASSVTTSRCPTQTSSATSMVERSSSAALGLETA